MSGRPLSDVHKAQSERILAAEPQLEPRQGSAAVAFTPDRPSEVEGVRDSMSVRAGVAAWSARGRRAPAPRGGEGALEGLKEHMEVMGDMAGFAAAGWVSVSPEVRRAAVLADGGAALNTRR